MMNRARPLEFATLEAMLDSTVLQRIFTLPETIQSIEREIIEEGYSGAYIERLILQGSHMALGTAVLKHIDPLKNWFLRASGDTIGREIMLTRSGIWERIPAVIATPILAAVHWPDGAGAMIMQDISDIVWPASMCYQENTPDPSPVPQILNALAELHIAFWNDSALVNLDWLTPRSEAMFYLTPKYLEHAGLNQAGSTYGEEAIRMWQRLWAMLEPEDAGELLRIMEHPEALLASIATLPQTLIHGDAWLANMGLKAGQLYLLDWALVARGPCTYDALWLAHTWHALDVQETMEQYRSALIRKGLTAVQDQELWQLLIDVAWVRTIFLGAEWLAREVIGAPTNETERIARAHLRYWCHHAAEIIRTRGW